MLEPGWDIPSKKGAVNNIENAQVNFPKNLFQQLTCNYIEAAGSGLHAGNDFIKYRKRNGQENIKYWWYGVAKALSEGELFSLIFSTLSKKNF